MHIFPLIIISSAGICTFLTLWYLVVILLFRIGLSRLKPGTGSSGNSFSVIVAARNEEAAIAACLESLAEQSIGSHRYEVIVVDDRSTDRTRAIINEFGARYPHIAGISVTSVPAGAVPKKNAVMSGMAIAHYPIIVLTDADCRVPPHWLASIDTYFTNDTGLVQGITTYLPLPGMNPLFFGFQAIDFLSHGIVAAAAIGLGLPLNANANNLAFRKSAFDDVGGWGEQSGVVSGDDDLLLQRIWKSRQWKVEFLADKRGAVKTLATATIAEMFEQRKRWGSITVHYNPAQMVMLAGVFFFYLAISIVLLCGFFNQVFFWCGLWMLTIKILGELVLTIPGTRLLGERGLAKMVPFASLPQLLLTIYAVFFGVFGKFNWKGRAFGRRV